MQGLKFGRKRRGSSLKSGARKKTPGRSGLRFERERGRRRRAGAYGRPAGVNVSGALRWAAEIILVCAAAFLLVLSFGCRVSNAGDSMKPVLENGEVVLVNRLCYRIFSPSRGDIVAYSRDGSGQYSIKRIVGLPGEHKEDVEHTLEEVKKLQPDSLTVHSLAVKRAARLNIFRDQYQEMEFENNQEIMNMAMKYAYEMDMGPYYLYRQKNMCGNLENTGFAKVDKAGIYNILMMEEKQSIMAAGAGASTKFVFQNGERIERAENVKDVTNYINRIDEMIQRKKVGIDTWLKEI